MTGGGVKIKTSSFSFDEIRIVTENIMKKEVIFILFFILFTVL